MEKQEFVNENFQSLIENNFLTENVSIFLYSLVKCCRPKKLLEIGCGYSTLFLCKALEDIKKEINLDLKYNIFDEKINPEFWKNSYEPYLEVIENGEIDYLNHDYNHVLKIINQQSLNKYIKFNFCDANEFIKNSKFTESNYDLIWVDYGSSEHYINFFESFFESLTPGGIIVFHSTLSNFPGRLFVAEMKLRQKNSNDFELISFFEPHKVIQNSFTVIRKVDNTPIYTVYS